MEDLEEKLARLRNKYLQPISTKNFTSIIAAGLIGAAVFGILIGSQFIGPRSAPILVPTYTPALEQVIESPTLIRTPTPRPTSTPTPTPQEVPFENPYVTMRLLSASSVDGNLRIKVLGAGSPIQGQEFDIYHGVRDITGMWSKEREVASDIDTNINGEVRVDLPPGDYILTESSFEPQRLLSPRWGIKIRSDWYFSSEGIPFSIVSGKDLEITLNLGVLDVGVLDAGGSAVYDHLMYILPQSQDIAGNLIVGGIDYRTDFTDRRGLVRFLVGLGPYLICTYNEMMYDPSLIESFCVTNVIVSSGEHREMRIVTVPGVYGNMDRRITDWWWVQ